MTIHLPLLPTALSCLLFSIGPAFSADSEPAAPAADLLEATVAEEPIPVDGTPWPVLVEAYRLPVPDPAWIVDENFVRTCTLKVTFSPGKPLVVEPATCQPEALAASTTALAAWRFRPAEGVISPTVPTHFPVSFLLRYDPTVATLTIHAEVDPGRKLAFEGVSGPPGVKLVHPAVPIRQVVAAAPKTARKAGIVPSSCPVQARVDPDGKVQDVQVGDTCPEDLRSAVEKAASKWRFSPKIVDGVTDAQLVSFDVGF